MNNVLRFLVLLLTWPLLVRLVVLAVASIARVVWVVGRRLIALDDAVVICPAWRTHVVVLRKHV